MQKVQFKAVEKSLEQILRAEYELSDPMRDIFAMYSNYRTAVGNNISTKHLNGVLESFRECVGKFHYHYLELMNVLEKTNH